jgi:hypothetical protein
MGFNILSTAQIGIIASVFLQVRGVLSMGWIPSLTMILPSHPLTPDMSAHLQPAATMLMPSRNFISSNTLNRFAGECSGRIRGTNLQAYIPLYSSKNSYLMSLRKVLLNRRMSNKEYRILKRRLHWLHSFGSKFFARYSKFQILSFSH